MKQHLILSFVIAAVAIPAMATRALPQFRVNALAEKTDAVISIDQGALSAFAGSRDPNGILATTKDFKGAALKAYVIFADSVAEDAIVDLASFQGKIAGTLQCKRIRMGSSPDFPQVKTAVLAENCVIKQLNQ